MKRCDVYMLCLNFEFSWHFVWSYCFMFKLARYNFSFFFPLLILYTILILFSIKKKERKKSHLAPTYLPDLPPLPPHSLTALVSNVISSLWNSLKQDICNITTQYYCLVSFLFLFNDIFILVYFFIYLMLVGHFCALNLHFIFYSVVSCPIYIYEYLKWTES